MGFEIPPIHKEILDRVPKVPESHRVPMNTTKLFPISGNTLEHYYSGSFDGCIGVVICARTGLLIGHYNPQNPEASEAKIRPNLKEAYEEGKGKLKEAKAYVLWDDDQGHKWHLSSVVTFLKTTLGLAIPGGNIVTYENAPPAFPNSVKSEEDEKAYGKSGEARICILVEYSAGATADPTVYIGGRKK